ncbi:polysaccharide biosynthesis tyrosine autokinase [Acidobacteria bacterium AH-259-D05]|nr:polysaccharide biosynthesis tyrosine autokinase [Acidobacteria bacterium AH-259-D05]
MSDLIKQEQTPTPPQPYQSQGSNYSFHPLEENSLDLLDYWQVILKHKWLIVSVVLTVMAGVAIHTFTVTPVYKSTATIQIDPELIDVLQASEAGVYAPAAVVEEPYLRTKFNLLQSQAIALRVVIRLALAEDPIFNAPTRNGSLSETLSLLKESITSLFTAGGENHGTSFTEQERKDPQDLNAAAARLRGALQVTPVEGTRLVEISYISHDPGLAARVVNTLAEEAIEENFETQYKASTLARDFLQKQLLEMKIKVEKSEEELIHYVRAHNLFNLDQGSNFIMQKLEYLIGHMTEAEGELISITTRHEVVKKATVQNFPNALRNPTIVNLENRLFELEQTLRSLSIRFGPEWPDVIQVNEQILKVQEQILKEKEEAIEQAHFEYKAVLEQVKMFSAAQQKQQELVEQLNESSIQYNILKRETETNKQLYDGLLQRLKETGVSAGLRSSNIHIVDYAGIPGAIYRPRTSMNLALGLILGLVLGGGLALFMEYIDNTVKTPDDIQKFLALPSLGAIPAADTLSQLIHKSLVQHQSQSDGVSVLPYMESKSPIWEAYRSLRTSILLSHSGKPPQTILVTSALPKEGKTTTVINTAIVLAQTGARTLIVDLDMRKPMLAGLFGVNGNQGMSTFLSGNSDLASQIREIGVPNLFLLTAGKQPPNPAELIGSERTESALRLLGEHFEYIVIDSPPILSVTDALVLSPLVDGSVLVIQAGKTPRNAVNKAKDHLVGVGAKILGAMINNVDLNNSKYAYYYRHYYDYNYYSEDSSSAWS